MQYTTLVQEVFDRIADAPEIYEQVLPGVRRGIVCRYPYQVLYQLEERQILVLAVFHGKRNPKIWQARI